MTLVTLPALAHRYGTAAVAGAQLLVNLIAELHSQSRRLAPAQMLDLALEKSGYQAWIASKPDAAS